MAITKPLGLIVSKNYIRRYNSRRRGKGAEKVNITNLKTGQSLAITPLVLLTPLMGTKTIIQSQIHQLKTQIILTPFMKR